MQWKTRKQIKEGIQQSFVQIQASFKTKITNILIFKEEIAPIVQATAASHIAGKFSS